MRNTSTSPLDSSALTPGGFVADRGFDAHSTFAARPVGAEWASARSDGASGAATAAEPRLQMTDHARARARQRAIPPLIVDWLARFGAACHDGHGATIRYFDQRSRKALAREVGHVIVDRLGALLDTYVVLAGDGAVITTGHRVKRVNRR